jgi:hypothetical protein
MIVFVVLLHFANAFATEPSRWTFVGDVLLGREVEHEIHVKKGANPWADLAFGPGETVVGNFEGALGKASDCAHPSSLCLSVDPRRIDLLAKAGFKYLGLENNHAHDTGEGAPVAAMKALSDRNLVGIRFEDSPYFVRKDGVGIALVAVDLVSPTRPSPVEIEKKIRLAKRLSRWTVVLVHWGTELLGWANDDQKARAAKLVEWGADLIIGSHPHVVQPPACVAGKPVYYSLGNHLFDQRYTSTHVGLAVRCAFERDRFSCERRTTRRESGSSFPKWDSAKTALLDCEREVRAAEPATARRWEAVSGESGRSLVDLDYSHEKFRSTAFRLEGFAPFRTGSGESAIFIAHRAYSDLDGKIALRPAVYTRGPLGIKPLWKGSALAYPVDDMDVLHDGEQDFLCARHEAYSHFDRKPVPEEFRSLAYRWNGFGFSRDPLPNRQTVCHAWSDRKID